MGALRVLLIEKSPEECERISSVLEQANHEVLPAKGFQDACEAVQVQKFDAVLVGSPEVDEIAEFTGKLRELEKRQHQTGRTAVISFAAGVGDACGSCEGANPGVDGYLPREFEANTFSQVVTMLARAVAHPQQAGHTAVSDLPIFEPEEFQAQVAHDRDLLIEIIDLFLVESVEQLHELRKALAATDYNRLSRGAHTIKGSLASLHAPCARAHAQALELAANQQEEQVCRFSLTALEQDLEILAPHLLALRAASSI